MTQTLEQTRARPAAVDPADADPDPVAHARSATLVAALSALDRAGVAYCVTHNFDGLPNRVGTDVDAVVTPAALDGPAPRALLAAGGEAQLVQWLDDRACWAVRRRPRAGAACRPSSSCT